MTTTDDTRDPLRMVLRTYSRTIALAQMVENDYQLLHDIVRLARTKSGVTIPTELFVRIQDRVREVELERKAHDRLPEDDEERTS